MNAWNSQSSTWSGKPSGQLFVITLIRCKCGTSIKRGGRTSCERGGGRGECGAGGRRRGGSGGWVGEVEWGGVAWVGGCGGGEEGVREGGGGREEWECEVGGGWGVGVAVATRPSCQVPLQGDLVLCIPQSANLCNTAHRDTSCNQVRQSHSVISARALFNSRRFNSGSSNGLTRHSP